MPRLLTAGVRRLGRQVELRSFSAQQCYNTIRSHDSISNGSWSHLEAAKLYDEPPNRLRQICYTHSSIAKGLEVTSGIFGLSIAIMDCLSPLPQRYLA